MPFTVYDYDNIEVGYTVPRLTAATPISDYHVASNPQAIGPNTFSLLTLPEPASFAPLNSTLGISDLGPFPAGMTGRNTFRGPGAWNLDSAVEKDFKLTERFGMNFRAEGFNIFNHHNMYTFTPDTLLLRAAPVSGAADRYRAEGWFEHVRFRRQPRRAAVWTVLAALHVLSTASKTDAI